MYKVFTCLGLAEGGVCLENAGGGGRYLITLLLVSNLGRDVV